MLRPLSVLVQPRRPARRCWLCKRCFCRSRCRRAEAPTSIPSLPAAGEPASAPFAGGGGCIGCGGATSAGACAISPAAAGAKSLPTPQRPRHPAQSCHPPLAAAATKLPWINHPMTHLLQVPECLRQALLQCSGPRWTPGPRRQQRRCRLRAFGFTARFHRWRDGLDGKLSIGQCCSHHGT